MLSQLPDEEVQRLHPAHTAATVRECLPRLRHYDQGMCAVHHMFGGQASGIVRHAMRHTCRPDDAPPLTPMSSPLVPRCARRCVTRTATRT